MPASRSPGQLGTVGAHGGRDTWTTPAFPPGTYTYFAAPTFMRGVFRAASVK
jgi:hypothetical protein